MTFPNIPEISPVIDLCREDVINLLLASVAFEELGLAHIINAEAEKIQFVLGTLENSYTNSCGSHPQPKPTIDQILEVNNSVDRVLRTVAKNQMLLQFKLEDVLDIPPEQPCESDPPCKSNTKKTEDK